MHSFRVLRRCSFFRVVIYSPKNINRTANHEAKKGITGYHHHQLKITYHTHFFTIQTRFSHFARNIFDTKDFDSHSRKVSCCVVRHKNSVVCAVKSSSLNMSALNDYMLINIDNLLCTISWIFLLCCFTLYVDLISLSFDFITIGLSGLIYLKIRWLLLDDQIWNWVQIDLPTLRLYLQMVTSNGNMAFNTRIQSKYLQKMVIRCLERFQTFCELYQVVAHLDNFYTY